MWTNKRAVLMAILNTGGGVYWPMDWRSIHKWCIKVKGRLSCLIQGPCIERENEILIYDAYIYTEREIPIDLWCIHVYRERDIYWYINTERETSIDTISWTKEIQ